jgi:hypothetical protein
MFRIRSTAALNSPTAGIDNANPDISEVGLVNFGFGTQPLVAFAAGGDQSFVQVKILAL